MFESRRYRRKPVLTNAISVTVILMASVNSVNISKTLKTQKYDNKTITRDTQTAEKIDSICDFLNLNDKRFSRPVKHKNLQDFGADLT